MRRIIVLLTLILCASPLARSQTKMDSNHGNVLAIHRCAGWQLSAKHESDDAGAGQRYVTYSFRNKSITPCKLSGFPSFTLLNSHGHRMHGQSITHTSEPVTSVTLAAGAKAFFNIHYSACSTVGTPPCRFSSRVRIKAPHTSRAFRLRERLDPFQLSVEISPIKSTAP